MHLKYNQINNAKSPEIKELISAFCLVAGRSFKVVNCFKKSHLLGEGE